MLALQIKRFSSADMIHKFSALSVFCYVCLCQRVGICLWFMCLRIYYIQNKTPTFTHGNTNMMLHSLRFLCCFLPDKSPSLPLPYMLYFSLRPVLSFCWTPLNMFDRFKHNNSLGYRSVEGFCTVLSHDSGIKTWRD